jgi:aspartyl-tRNA(Asn)/glutamyl-tRNA(Gln) amidotransferase subunit C
MSSPQLDVQYVANLARISLSEEEISKFQEQLTRVLGHLDQLARAPIEGVDPTAHAFPVYDVLRADEPVEGLAKEKALDNAPAKSNGLFRITKVMD